MDTHISETGIIDSIEGKNIFIVRENPPTCDNCKIKSMCNIQNKQKISIKTDEVYEIGEKIELIINPKIRLLSSFLVYILPVISLILIYYIANIIFKLSETISIIISFSSLFIVYFLIKYIDKKFEHNHNISIKRLVKNENSP